VKVFTSLTRNEMSHDSGVGIAEPKPLAAPDEIVRDLVKLFKLLSDATRLRILYHLKQERELHVRALCELLDESQPAVSHHLALLRSAGLIGRRREGKHNYYGLRTQRFSALLETLFVTRPDAGRSIRFEDYLLDREPEVLRS
jgi:ArsR family transcriptional regulator